MALRVRRKRMGTHDRLRSVVPPFVLLIGETYQPSSLMYTYEWRQLL